MTTLTLNTSVTSSHKDDFYSTTDEYWIRINNPIGNYFSDLDCPYGNPMDFYARIYETNTWKYIGGCPGFDHYYPPCYQYCEWNFIYVRYYNYDDTNDPDNYKYIDKIAVTYLGLRNESFVNRCFVNITAIDNNNIPLYGVTVLDLDIPTTDDPNFLAFTTENGGDPVCVPNCRDPLTTSIGTELRACNTEVSLMQTQKQNDCILIETEGIPTKLTFTISTPGIYTGTLNYQYWNGVDWVYFPEAGVIDETNGFRNSGVRNVTLPIVSDWKKRIWGLALFPTYICRVIFDSQPSVTTAPKASCLRWSGSYESVTDSSGIFQFTAFTSGGIDTTIPGTLSGYICTSGNGQLIIPEATETKDIILTLVKSDLTCNITCPTPIYTKQTKNILVTSTVSTGGISNTLTISSPKTNPIIFNPTYGTDIPISYTFNEEDIYKIQLRSEDDGGNVAGKTLYINVTTALSCNLLTDQLSCELNGCFWTGNNCISTDPHIELTNIYQSIIDKTTCISDECINTLDLNNDGLIDLNDKNLVSALTYNETISKIMSYQICKEMYSCESEPKLNTSSILIGGITLGLAYIYIKTKKKQ